MKTRDIDIRDILHKTIRAKYSNTPGTIVIDELSLCHGNARIDIAVVNKKIHGYEIKSESDTLDRLPNQIKVYGQVMDTITIVTGMNHLNKIEKTVPPWWGIKVVQKNPKSMQLKTIRRPKQNPDINAMELVKLLWKDEALSILEEKGLDKGYRSKSRVEMWERLAESLSLNELKYHVNNKLKNRKEWRADQL